MDTRKNLSEAACTEAAGWVSRLHGPHRTPAAEAGFRRWMAENPENALAFEFLTEVWESSGRLQRRPLEQIKSWQLPGMRVSLSRAAFAGSAIALLAVVGTLFFIRSGGVSTGVGEQRSVVLEDGTRMHLNTDTRAVVRFDGDTRLVELKKGEALFEVAKQPGRPFVVLAGERQVRALATAFVVRHEAQKLAVTLVEGRVAVSAVDLPSLGTAARSELSSPADSAHSKPTSSSRREEGTLTLSPGQRLTFQANQAPRLDTPQLSKLTAWQRGQVDLEGTSLADAVAEMNRYSKKRIVIGDPRAAGIRVSGVFGAGDTENFVAAVAHNYRLDVRHSSDEIVLGGASKE